jgi:hypothetical protein
MLRTTNPQHSLWEAILPEVCLGLPPSWPASWSRVWKLAASRLPSARPVPASRP